jgi:folate-binding protein YgfZ
MSEIPPLPARYAVLALSGTDARAFLNGQCTQNTLDLLSDSPVPTAVLTPQGRILAFGWVRPAEDGLRFALPADLAEPLLAHLKRYVLRAKVRMTLAVALEEDLPTAIRASAVGTQGLQSIRAGLPEVSAQTSGEWIPQMLNLDLIGAVRFDKGCYTGQEIVARTQHLGRIKRRMARFRLQGTPPDALCALFLGDQKVGEVVIAAPDEKGNAECLAVISLDAVSCVLTLADGRTCEPLSLPYSLEPVT